MSFLNCPGCRFYPSDHEVVHHFLSSKNSTSESNFHGYDLIKELDLYEYEPFDLPDNVGYKYGIGGRRKHWFCYAKIRALQESKRSTKDGFWRRSGKVRDVVGPNGNVVVGTRTRFVYYSGGSGSTKNPARTDWILYEYALLDCVKASFVMCRVFVKSRRGGNSVCDCGDESVSAVRHVGVQCDGGSSLECVLSKSHMGDEADRKNVLFKNTFNLAGEVDTGFRFDSTAFPKQPVLSELSKDELVAILEDDFLELDDLID